MANVFERDGRFTILDWGDSSVGHPFATMWVTLRVVARVHSLEVLRTAKARPPRTASPRFV